MPPKSLTDRVKEGPVLLDGAMGSLLMDMGLHSGQPPEEWSMKYPERIGKAHQLYHEAGSDILQTNTFGASHYRLKECGIAEHHDLVNRRAVEICREYGGDSLVAGPNGSINKPDGPISPATKESPPYSRQISTARLLTKSWCSAIPHSFYR
jgi:5-methyltetrahydrofolate--homocysteine methyltransferase